MQQEGAVSDLKAPIALIVIDIRRILRPTKKWTCQRLSL